MESQHGKNNRGVHVDFKLLAIKHQQICKQELYAKHPELDPAMVDLALASPYAGLAIGIGKCVCDELLTVSE